MAAVGRIAREFNLYTKITGSSRVSVCLCAKDDLPEICQLIEAGFENRSRVRQSAADGENLRRQHSCRYGVGDSVGFGVSWKTATAHSHPRTKMKFGVSGCKFVNVR